MSEEIKKITEDLKKEYMKIGFLQCEIRIQQIIRKHIATIPVDLMLDLNKIEDTYHV